MNNAENFNISFLGGEGVFNITENTISENDFVYSIDFSWKDNVENIISLTAHMILRLKTALERLLKIREYAQRAIFVSWILQPAGLQNGRKFKINERFYAARLLYMEIIFFFQKSAFP